MDHTFPATDARVGKVMLYGTPIFSLVVDDTERLCLAQISGSLLKDFSYNEIHNRRVALGITCIQCTPIQLEVLRRAGAMPVSSRRCGLITKREAERLVKSFLEDIPPPQLPGNFKFEVHHDCGWGCRGSFSPAKYSSSRAKCIECSLCHVSFSPNKFIFHYHKLPTGAYRHPDAANYNSWRRHLKLPDTNPPEELLVAWEDVKAMFNGGSRKRTTFKQGNPFSYNNMRTSEKMENYKSNVYSDLLNGTLLSNRWSWQNDSFMTPFSAANVHELQRSGSRYYGDICRSLQSTYTMLSPPVSLQRQHRCDTITPCGLQINSRHPSTSAGKGLPVSDCGIHGDGTLSSNLPVMAIQFGNEHVNKSSSYDSSVKDAERSRPGNSSSKKDNKVQGNSHEERHLAYLLLGKGNEAPVIPASSIATSESQDCQTVSIEHLNEMLQEARDARIQDEQQKDKLNRSIVALKPSAVKPVIGPDALLSFPAMKTEDETFIRNKIVYHQQAKDKKLKHDIETRIHAAKELILASSLSESLAAKSGQGNSDQVCLAGSLTDIEDKLHDIAKQLNLESELGIMENQWTRTDTDTASTLVENKQESC